MPELRVDTKAFQTCIQAEGGLEGTTPESVLGILGPTTFSAYKVFMHAEAFSSLSHPTSFLYHFIRVMILIDFVDYR